MIVIEARVVRALHLTLPAIGDICRTTYVKDVVHKRHSVFWPKL